MSGVVAQKAPAIRRSEPSNQTTRQRRKHPPDYSTLLSTLYEAKTAENVEK